MKNTVYLSVPQFRPGSDPDRQDKEIPLEDKKKNVKGLMVELWSECFPNQLCVEKPPIETESVGKEDNHIYDSPTDEEMYRQDYEEEEEVEVDEGQYYGYHSMDEYGRYYNIDGDEVDIYGRMIDDYP